MFCLWRCYAKALSSLCPFCRGHVEAHIFFMKSFQKSSFWSQFSHLWASILLMVCGVYITVQSFPPFPSCCLNYNSSWRKKEPRVVELLFTWLCLRCEQLPGTENRWNHKACPHRGALWFDGDRHLMRDEMKSIPVLSGDSQTCYLLMWLKWWGRRQCLIPGYWKKNRWKKETWSNLQIKGKDMDKGICLKVNTRQRG